MPILHRGLAPKFRLRFLCLLRLLESRALHGLYPSPVGSSEADESVRLYNGASSILSGCSSDRYRRFSVPISHFPYTGFERTHKTVDVITTSGPAALFKKFTKIANVRRSSWAIGQAIRIAYCMGLIKKMMLGYGRCACPSSPLATIENLSSQPARHCRMARQPR